MAELEEEGGLMKLDMFLEKGCADLWRWPMTNTDVIVATNLINGSGHAMYTLFKGSPSPLWFRYSARSTKQHKVTEIYIQDLYYDSYS